MPDKQYLNLIKKILANGNPRIDRTGTGTLSVFGEQLKFNINNTIPILTTKRVAYHSISKELLWFLRGQTDSKILEAQGVNIWKGNSSKEFLRKRNLPYSEGTIGPMYFFNILHSGAKYRGPDVDYTGHGVNQLDEVIDLLRTDPFSRRILMTTYRIENRHQGVLYPCHGLAIQFHVEEKMGVKYLNCLMYQRSCDVFLGLPFNMVSYAILTHIIAKKVGMVPSELTISLGDAHIYNNHMEAVNLQLSRTPFPAPTFSVRESVCSKEFKDITIDDFELQNYTSHTSIKALMSV